MSPTSCRPGCSGLPRLATRGRDDLGVERTGEEQELLDLVAADVAEDAAILLAVEEVVGARLLLLSACGPRPTVLTTLPMAPAATSSPALTVERRLEMLGVADREDAAGLLPARA